MYNNYKCPKCRGNVRLGDSIILSGKSKGLPGGLILLHPELGNYSIETHPEFNYKKGDIINFHCPICHHNLDSSKHLNLAMIVMNDDTGQEFDIYFSKIAGEQSTLKMIGEHMEIFGEHTEGYMDFFSMSLLY